MPDNIGRYLTSNIGFSFKKMISVGLNSPNTKHRGTRVKYSLL